MAVGLRRERSGLEATNNFETLGVGEVTPGECKEGEEVGAPSEQKHLKVTEGKRSSCDRRERRTRENREEPVEQNVSVEMVHSVR